MQFRNIAYDDKLRNFTRHSLWHFEYSIGLCYELISQN